MDFCAGPVLILDTAGLDDNVGPLGAAIDKTRGRSSTGPMWRCSWQSRDVDGTSRRAWSTRRRCAGSPFWSPSTDRPEEAVGSLSGEDPDKTVSHRPYLQGPAQREGYREALQGLLMTLAPEDVFRVPLADPRPPACGGLGHPCRAHRSGGPKGRIILPQVQTIRDALDGDAMCLIVKEHETSRRPERTQAPAGSRRHQDSRAVRKVCDDVPMDIPVTTFCVLRPGKKAASAHSRRAAASKRCSPATRSSSRGLFAPRPGGRHRPGENPPLAAGSSWAGSSRSRPLRGGGSGKTHRTSKTDHPLRRLHAEPLASALECSERHREAGVPRDRLRNGPSLSAGRDPRTLAPFPEGP